MPYTFPTSSIAEPFNNPYNPDYLARRFRGEQSGSLHAQIPTIPTSSQLTVSESVYYYLRSDTK